MAHDSNNLVYTSKEQRLLFTMEDRQIRYGLQLQQLNTRLLEVESLLAEQIHDLSKLLVAVEVIANKVEKMLE